MRKATAENDTKSLYHSSQNKESKGMEKFDTEQVSWVPQYSFSDDKHPFPADVMDNAGNCAAVHAVDIDIGEGLASCVIATFRIATA